MHLILPLFSTTAESLTNNNEAELQRRCQERQQEIDHMQQVLETKIQLLQEVRLLHLSPLTHKHTLLSSSQIIDASLCGLQEAQLARSEAERMASMAGSHSHTSLVSLDAAMEEIPEDERPPHLLSPTNTSKDRQRRLKDLKNICSQKHQTNEIEHPFMSRLIEELSKELRSKEAFTMKLCEEKETLTLRVGELEDQVQDLSSSLLQKDKDVEVFMVIKSKNISVSICVVYFKRTKQICLCVSLHLSG